MDTTSSTEHTAMNNSPSISLPPLYQSNTDSDNDSEFEIESDITDEDHEPYDCHEIPPRPTSRLGFNCNLRQDLDTTLEPEKGKATASYSRSRSGTLKWTRSLFQKIGIAALPSPNCMPGEDIEDDQGIASLGRSELDTVPPSILPPLSSSSSSLLDGFDTDEAVIYSSGDSDDSDCSLYEESDTDLDLSPNSGCNRLLFPPTPPLPPPTPRAILTPTSDSPPSRSLSTRQKFSCLPSPLSPFSHIPPYSYPAFAINPQRHNYNHHGYSRHALLHFKWFWAVREAEWQVYSAHLQDEKAYGGISILAGTTCPVPLGPPGSNNKRYIPEKRSCGLQQLPPMTIHPRRGDICGLRDPYSAHIDRCFVGLPMWTMAKTLWMFDVHMGVEGRARAVTAEGDINDDLVGEESDEDMASSMSTGFSDDSDVTLVESESEGEVEMEQVAGRTNGGNLEGEEGMEDVTIEEVGVGVACGKNVKCFEREDAFTMLDALNVEPGPSPSSSHNLEHSSYDPPYPSKCKTSLTPTSQSSTQPAYSNPISKCSPTAVSNLPPWETNWYKRWELLIELVRLDRERERQRARLDSASSSVCAKTAGCGDAKLPRFYFAGETDEADGVGDGSGCGEETWSEALEEEDEEVVIVTNPLFMGRGMVRV